MATAGSLSFGSTSSRGFVKPICGAQSRGSWQRHAGRCTLRPTGTHLAPSAATRRGDTGAVVRTRECPDRKGPTGPKKPHLRRRLNCATVADDVRCRANARATAQGPHFQELRRIPLGAIRLGRRLPQGLAGPEVTALTFGEGIPKNLRANRSANGARRHSTALGSLAQDSASACHCPGLVIGSPNNCIQELNRSPAHIKSDAQAALASTAVAITTPVIASCPPPSRPWPESRRTCCRSSRGRAGPCRRRG